MYNKISIWQNYLKHKQENKAKKQNAIVYRGQPTMRDIQASPGNANNVK
jgi:hypothetical protein